MEVENAAITCSTANGNAPLARPAAGYVMLLLIIPGLDHVSVGCAMLMGRLLQETMDGALAGKGLLLAEPSYFRSKVADLQKATIARLKEMKAVPLNAQPAAAMHALSSISPDATSASSRFIEDVAERVYGGSLVSFVRNQDRFYFGFSVSDLEGGLPAVEAEVKRLGFLELAEIGHYDAADKVCRTYYPRNPATAVMSHCAGVLREAGLLPQG
jgi:hypothetical protein